jgi:hypothetical protein
MRDANYFLEQAERCFRLARAVTDREATGRLEALGTEFIGKAIELRARTAPVWAPATAEARTPPR